PHTETPPPLCALAASPHGPAAERTPRQTAAPSRTVPRSQRRTRPDPLGRVHLRQLTRRRQVARFLRLRKRIELAELLRRWDRVLPRPARVVREHVPERGGTLRQLRCGREAPG